MDGIRVVITGPRQVALQQFAIPVPGPHQVLVRTTATLVSAGTELKGYLGLDHGANAGTYPRRPGYSQVGVVEATGEGVVAVKPGDRVATLKEHASHVLVDLTPVSVPPEASLPTGRWPQAADWLQVIPVTVTDEQAIFAVLGSVALHGVRKAVVRIGEGCAIAGQGVVGQLVGQLARLSGAHPVIGIDLDAERLQRSQESGIDFQIAGAAGAVTTEVRSLTEGKGIDLAFDCTGTTDAFPALLKMAAFAGRIVIVGSLVGTVEISLYDDIQLKELTIIGTHQPKVPGYWHPSAPWTQAANRRFILELLASGRLRVDHLISHRVPVTEAAALYEQMAAGPRGWLGVVFYWE